LTTLSSELRPSHGGCPALLREKSCNQPTDGPMAMSNRTLRMSLSVLAASAVLMLAGPARAGIWSSDYDPIGSITFSGRAFFQFDDSCLAVDGFYSAAFCHTVFLSATADISDTSPATGHLNFASVLPNTANVGDIVIVNHALAGVDTGVIGSVFPGPCTGDLCGTPWWIQFESGLEDPVFLFTGSCPDGPSTCTPNISPQGVATNVTFARVPEPGLLALILGALGAGWLARRRKSAA
jgi:hypothetical protein